MNCKLVLSQRSQFFHSRRFFSNQAKLRSTTQRFGMTLKVCNSLRFTICTVKFLPSVSRTLHKKLTHIAAVAQHTLHLF